MLDSAINAVIGVTVFVIASAGVGTVFYYLGKYQGRW